MKIRGIYVSISAVFAFTACAPLESFTPPTSQNSPNLDLGNVPVDGGHKDPGGGGSDGGKWEGLKICSKLDFKSVEWSANLEIPEREPFALALNISGSFEGQTGWANLTNNFDGMGLSMGLLNQNLGQGSLQPMWLEMRNESFTAMGKIFSAANFTSVLKMLAKWEGTVIPASLDLVEYGYSELDDPHLIAADLGLTPLELEEVQVALLARNQESVDWAKKTLYTGSSFKSDWSAQLKSLANSPGYRSIQIRKAENLHVKTGELMASLNFRELRSYLFFFDIVVQNGGISTSVRNEYKTWLRSNASATEKKRLQKILEIRLRTVRSQYVKDVRDRKTAIINGTGTVHGSKRDFEKEYCTDIDKKIQL